MSRARSKCFRLGCLAALLLCCSPARADAVADWNAIAAAAASGQGSDKQSRVVSIVNAAMLEAVRASSPGTSTEAAAAAAAHYVLCQIYPDRRVSFTLALVRSLEAIPDGIEKAIGQVMGTGAGKKAYASGPATTLSAGPSR